MKEPSPPSLLVHEARLQTRHDAGLRSETRIPVWSWYICWREETWACTTVAGLANNPRNSLAGLDRFVDHIRSRLPATQYGDALNVVVLDDVGLTEIY